MVETELIEKKELREQMVGRVEVLNKVKELMLLQDNCNIRQAGIEEQFRR